MTRRKNGAPRRRILRSVSAVIVGALALGSCATVGEPAVTVEHPDTVYISPANRDGVQDTVKVPVSVVADRKATVTAVTLTVYNEGNAEIRKIETVAPEGKKSFPDPLLKALRLKKAKGVEVPEYLLWDGTDGAGNFVADGAYTCVVAVADDKKHAVTTEPIAVVVDNAPPSPEVSAPYGIFSPNGDKNRDTLPIVQYADGKALWRGAFLNENGAEVFAEDWGATLPYRYEWKGVTRSGAVLPDGMYRYALTGTDLAGNVGTSWIENIILDTKSSPLYVDVSSQAFSPNGDSVKDTVKITPILTAPEGLAGITVRILDGAGKAMRTWSLAKAEPVAWDGLSDAGLFCPDGAYVAETVARFENGNAPKVRSKPIVLDTAYPRALIRKPMDAFSPNGDGKNDRITFEFVEASEEPEWKGEIVALGGHGNPGEGKGPGEGEPVKTVEWAGKPGTFEWDGRDDAGEPLGEGTYAFRLVSVDPAGNGLTERTEPFALNLTALTASLSLSPLPFSPDGDGVNDTVTITPRASGAYPVTEWEIAVQDRAGTVFRRFSGKGAPTKAITWDGTGDSGEAIMSAEDYAVRLTVADSEGNETFAQATLPVDILVMKAGDRYFISIASIYFSPYSAEFPQDKRAANAQTLARLADILKRYPAYPIAINGHAVRIYWNDKAKGEAEERDVLAPLSLARANRIRETLISLGVEADRMTAAGVGGTQPVVPNSDLQNRWKNRRVVFVLGK